MGQILAIAGTTLGEAIRRRVLLIILMVGLAFLIIAPSLSQLTPRGQTNVLTSMTLGILKITAAILAVTLTVYLLPNEVERRTIYTILSKPVQRWQFLLGKYLGSVAALSLMIGLMAIVLIIAFALQQGSVSLTSLDPLIKAPIMLVFQMSLLAAVAMFFSTFASPVVNFFLTALVYVFGTLLNPFFESVTTKQNTVSVNFFANIAHYAFPNFSNLDIKTGAEMEQQITGSETVYMMNGVIYALVYCAILVTLAVLVFDRREL
ncbi:MAG: ABC transporter permease [Armatimonadetes bacterium]|nr:ABC transporter permease [Armatimonadota bacterium]